MASQYLKDLKNLFKTKQKLQEEETEAVQEAVEKEKEIVKKMAELEDEYNKTLVDDTPDFDEMFKPVTLERVSYDLLSDDEIEKKAVEEVEKNYASKISDINSKTLEKIESENAKKENAKEEKTKTLEEIDALFSTLKENAKNKSIKQGVQRGSILDSAISDIKEGVEDKKLGAEATYQDKLSAIDDEIKALDEERVSALSSLNLKKAVETTERIDTLKTQREKLKADELKANNSIAKQETDENIKIEKEKAKYIKNYNDNKEKQDALTAKYEEENGYSGEKLQNYAERYNIALEFYLSLDPDISLKALEASANMKHYLGNYYDKLEKVLSERTSTKTKKYI